MATYIRKETALEVVKKYETTNGFALGRHTGLAICIASEIAEIPAADVAPVVHGRWIPFLDGDHIMPERYYRCSRCGRVESRCQPYCHCGAKMDGGDSDEADCR